MSVIDKLASSLGRRDEVPNQLLAKQIAGKSDKNAIKELVENLNNKDKKIQSDCIKTLYEIGERKPELISPYVKNFIKLLDSKNNRLQWGAMTALSSVVNENPKEIYSSLAKIVEVGDKGSVITKDHLVKILVGIGSNKQYNDSMFQLLLEQIKKSPVNQLPSYIESTATIVSDKNKPAFIKAINFRMKEVEDLLPKKKRMEKVLKNLY